MKNFNLVFQNNPLSDAYALLISSVIITREEYIKNGYIPATDYYIGNSRTIAFPDITYEKYPDYWEKMKAHKPKMILKETDEIKFIQGEIGKREEQKYIEKLNIIETFWKTHEEKFIEFLNIFAPEFQKKKIEIEVNIKTYGAPVDFTSPDSEGEQVNGYVSVRIDMPEEKLIHGIFATLLTQNLEKIYRWREKKAILDFLTESFLKNIIHQNEVTGVIESLEKFITHKKLISNSQEFLNKNKLIRSNFIYINEKGRVEMFSRELAANYSTSEIEILRQFILKDDHTLSYDDIADIVWGDQAIEKFSLTTISKRIERLRNKLYDEGMPSSGIMAVKGVGYYLNV